MDWETRRTLYKIAKAYYEDGLTQEQIGERLGLSRAKVSRMLQRAREENVVRITVLAPESNADLERALEDRFGLDEAVLVSTPGEDKDADEIVQIVYEGYGPNGVAMMIDVVTDNRNRSVAAVRHALTRVGGSMANPGAVAWQFDRRGQIRVSSSVDFEDLFIWDEFDPMEEDLAKYGEQPNNKTYFVHAGLGWGPVYLKAIYGWVKDAVIEDGWTYDGEATELDIYLNVDITENIELELVYCDINDDYKADGNRSFSHFSGLLAYKF